MLISKLVDALVNALGRLCFDMTGSCLALLSLRMWGLLGEWIEWGFQGGQILRCNVVVAL